MIVEIKDLNDIRKKHEGKKIVFCSGVFDLTHAGHIIFFEHCKKLGDVLVVAVGGDAFVKRRKGPGRPVLNEKIRVKAVDSLKAVDYVLLDDLSDENDPFKIFKIIGENLRPDLYAVRKDAFNLE